jgi:isopenicillin N synthase-like dioxygenase
MKLYTFISGNESKMARIVEYDSIPDISEDLAQFGYILVRGVPGFTEAFEEFVQQAHEFSKLTSEQQAQFTPTNSYENGWDRGIEIFRGRRDVYKGSYYAAYPDGPSNTWPSEEYRAVYLKLVEIVVQAGRKLVDILELPSNFQVTGRALDYAPVPLDDQYPFWCGEHRDHGMLTGLCPAVLFRGDERKEEPDDVGLSIQGCRAQIPRDCLAFQVGETAQLITNDRTRTTLHYVIKGWECRRLTMAVFMYPPDDYVINSETKADYLLNRYKPEMTYGEWATASFKAYK